MTSTPAATDPVTWLRERADPFEVVGDVKQTDEPGVFHVPVKWANPNHSDATVVVDLEDEDWFEL